MESSETMRIVIAEDSVSLAAAYCEYLSTLDAEVMIAATGSEADALVRTEKPDLVVLDVQFPDTDGVSLLKAWRDDGIETPVIVITAHGSVDIAVDAMRAGAFDFILKPFSAQRLITTAKNALSHRALIKEVATLRRVYEKDRLHDLHGASLTMQAVYRAIESAAQSVAPIFITGESGTGKELCAQAIQQAGSRAQAPFVALNCAAIPRELVESEVFGHKKGAFTGATSDREAAAGQWG